MTIGHDGNHFAITHKLWIWRVSTFVNDCINGLSSLTWTYEDTHGHHIYTSILESDPDIKMIDDGVKLFQWWFPNYRSQHIYMPILYLFLVTKMKLQDFHTVLIMKKANIWINL